MKIYDIIIIGAGSGGLVAATTAIRKGYKVALLEKNKIGGECTHTGCIPSKTLLYSAQMFESTKHLKEHYGLDGLEISGKMNFASVMKHVDSIVQTIYKTETPEVFEKQGIEVFVDKTGTKFINEHSVQIGKEILSFKYAVICTGSSPKKITITGSEEIEFLDNENFWSIRKLPASVIFIGGGIISAELGQALVRFGSKVTIIDRNPRILKPVEEDARKIIVGIFEKEGINIIYNAQLKKVRKGKYETFITYLHNEKEYEISAESIFLATGRQPSMAGLNLEKAGIEYSENGIKTNSFLQTSVPTIYSCGDVTSPQKFTHTASYQAGIAIENIMNGNKRENDLSALPWVIFTEPEIAHVGLSEKETKDKHENKIKVFKVEANFDRFVTDSSKTGFLKVIFNSENIVIGADAIGAHAGEWIQLLTVAIKNKIAPENFADTIFAYPTYSEIVKKAFTRFLRTQQ